jgi:pyruvate formate lyase activating enzyme
MKKSKPGKAMNGMIFNIQRYSIHDGPGIRTTVFLKGCPLACFWCQNPESQALEPEILFERTRCTACGQCVIACPSGSNALIDKAVKIDRNKCTGCGECVAVCPNQSRRLAGREATVDEVIEEVLRDRKFYESSGGGVTLSGGEPSLQADFALELLRRFKKEGLHTALDTCGYVSWKTLRTLLDYTDLVLFDIKCLDAARHSKATGKPNELIVENVRKIAGSGETWIRIPLVPGFNDSEEEVRAILTFIKRELGLTKIDLHRYNPLGEEKYARLDRPCAHLTPQPEEYAEKLREIAAEEKP